MARRRCSAHVQRQLERTRVLVGQGYISRQQLETDQARLALLEAQIATSQSQIEVTRQRVRIQRQYLQNTRIVAPFDGLVVEQPAQVGEIVSPVSAGGGFTRTGIATVLDTDSLAVEVNVSEQYIGQVRQGQPVTIRMQAYPDLALKGEVSTVMAAASRDTAAVKVQIALRDHDPRVLPNMGANVSFE